MKAEKILVGVVQYFFYEKRFFVKKIDYIVVPNGVEAIWVMVEPKYQKLSKFKKLCIASIYISPRSKFKSQTISHIIESIHYVRSKCSEVNFCIFSDANRVDVSDVLHSYGALQQVVLQPT